MDSHSKSRRIGLSVSCAFLLVLTALVAQPSGVSPFLPPQSTVVLLVGLPGDLESENTYRDQLQTWLDIVAGSGTRHRVFVLCDNPESFSLPENRERSEGRSPAITNSQSPATSYQSPITNHLSPIFLHADRSNFLRLAEMVPAASRSFVVIAWGHGGSQGNTPVLHVRGPRITPADFKVLAAQAPEAESHWVLLFRGSGAFARQLAGEHRQIVTSERDLMFTSDPVGMSVLLKVVKVDPAIHFARLAEEFGRATAAWFSERNLARTEEPTLWLGNDPPRLLAADSDGHPLASGKPEESSSPKKTTAPDAAARDLPVIWKDITRVEPQKYPDADAVILRRRLSYTLASNPALASEQDQFIQVLTLEGKRFGDFDISYSPPFEDINFLDCEVLSQDGKLERLDPEAIRETRDESVGDYHIGRRKFFSLPGVAPGAILHVRYQTQWKDFPLPQVSLEIPMSQELPAIASTIQVSVPKDVPFHFAFDQLSASTPEIGDRRSEIGPALRPPPSDLRADPSAPPDPTIKQTGYGATYEWRFENLPAHIHEILAPPGQGPRLLVSTFSDWPAFAEWYARIGHLADQVTPEIEAKAKELTREATGERDKVLALYNYVTRLRYVAVPLGVNSFRPHAAGNVLKNQFGDCKDKANLFNTLLHSLNIEAHLVLVPRFSQAHEAIPGLAFNHAISCVKLGAEMLWADTTDDVCRFGLLPPGDPGRNVLVIDGQTSTLTQLPPPAANEHQLTLRAEVNCCRPAAALPATLSVIALGYPDYELRSAAREMKEHSAPLPLLGVGFRPVAGFFALEKQSATSVSALAENFSWQADGAWVGTASFSAGKCSVRCPIWLPKEWELALHHRRAALFLNQGYPLMLEQEFEFALPAKAQAGALPSVMENKDEPLQWRIEWTKVGDDKLAAHFRAELARGELSLAETRRFQEQLRELLAALAASVNLSMPP